MINDPQTLKEWLFSQLPASVGGHGSEITLDADELLVIFNLNNEIVKGEGETQKSAE